MELWTVLEPVTATVRAGGTTEVQLRVRNTGDVVEEYRVAVVGDPAAWCEADPRSLRLYPGSTGTVVLRFAPPRTPDAAAGPNMYAVRISPTEDPGPTTVVEGNLMVLPFHDTRAELLPPSVRGRFRARPLLAVDNFGNTPLTASLSGRDTGDRLRFDIRPPAARITAGRALHTRLRIRPDRLLWTGPKVSHRFETVVQPSSGDPVVVSGTYVQRSLLPRWLFHLTALLAALAIAFAGLWFGFRPKISSDAVAFAPSATPTAVAQTPSPSARPSSPSPAPPQTRAPGPGGPAQAPPPPPPYQANTVIYAGPGSTCASSTYGSFSVTGYTAAPDSAPDVNGQYWYTDPNGGPTDFAPCSAAMSMPMLGRGGGPDDFDTSNSALYRFITPGLDQAKCLMFIFIPQLPPASANPEGGTWPVTGEPAYYRVFDGPSTSSPLLETLGVDQTQGRGTFSVVGVENPAHIHHAALTVQLVDAGNSDIAVGRSRPHIGVGPILVTCNPESN